MGKVRSKKKGGREFRLTETVKGQGAQPANRTLYVGKDNYDILSGMDSGTVDLVAMDPPFNKDAPFIGKVMDPALLQRLQDKRRQREQRGLKVEALDDKVIRFNDFWAWEADWQGDWVDRIATNPRFRGVKDVIRSAQAGCGDAMAAYICFMAARCLEIRRVLKDNGVLVLHCDHSASHVLRFLLDNIFGSQQFIDQVVWKRTSAHSDSKTFGKVYDILLIYGNRPINVEEVREAGADEHFKQIRRHDSRSAAGLPGGDQPHDFHEPDGPGSILHATMLRHDVDDRLHLSARTDGTTDVPGLANHRDKHEGQAPGNLWLKPSPVGSGSAERTGWPTQKPLALYERIIKACSEPGDMVLDPFCGCGTTCIAAERTGRRWIGIDLAEQAAVILDHRLHKVVGATAQVPAVQVLDFTVDGAWAVPRRTDAGETAVPYVEDDAHERFAWQERHQRQVHAPMSQEERDRKKQMLAARQHEDQPRLAKAGKYQCEICGGTTDTPDMLQLDHVIPVRFFSRHMKRADENYVHALANLQLVCGHCNASNGAGINLHKIE